MLHQDVCKAFNMSRDSLAKLFGISKATVDSWSDSSRMSKTAKVAMETMLENNNLKQTIGKFSDFLSDINKNTNDFVTKEQKELVDRMSFILDEYKLNIVEAAKKLNEQSFEYLDKVINLKIYPSFDFLSKFVVEFNISDKWLLSGKEKPFNVRFLKSGYMNKLIEEFPQYRQAYIVNCEEDGGYSTRLIIENEHEVFDVYGTHFCIGDGFIIEAQEGMALYELYTFYKKFGGSRVQLLKVSQEDYEKLFSRDFYMKNILDKAKHSHMLYDLFDLECYNKDRYGSFFENCVNIIKSKEKANS